MGVCLAVPRWVWEAVKISGLILFKSKKEKKQNNDCSVVAVHCNVIFG